MNFEKFHVRRMIQGRRRMWSMLAHTWKTTDCVKERIDSCLSSSEFVNPFFAFSSLLFFLVWTACITLSQRSCIVLLTIDSPKSYFQFSSDTQIRISTLNFISDTSKGFPRKVPGKFLRILLHRGYLPDSVSDLSWLQNILLIQTVFLWLSILQLKLADILQVHDLHLYNDLQNSKVFHT